MSDTTSFLGGAALAGLAAVILLKGGVTANSPMVGTPQYSQFQPLPTMPNAPGTYQSPMPNGMMQTADYEKLKTEMDQMRSQIEQYRLQNEQLKAQSQSQQAFIDSINKNGMNPVTARQQQPQQQSAGLFDTSNPAMSGLMWALGGMILTFGGGIALVGMFVLFARGQQRPSRTIEVFHDEYPTYIPSRRRATQVLPPRRTIKRVDAQDVD
jgi:hypothetical protein